MLDETRVGINFLESLRIENGMVVVDGVRASAMKTTRVCAWNLIHFLAPRKEGDMILKQYPKAL